MEYQDPAEFFGRTYITEGMSGLLVESLQRLSGRGGEPVIQLKTVFGGGKTHSLLALYHMVRSGVPASRIPGLEPVLKRAGLDRIPKANVAVVVGSALDPARRKNPPDLPGFTVGTLWGEIACQLVVSAGRPDLYAIVSDSDRQGVSPGSEALKTLLNSCGPCLILMDELVAYAKKIYGKTGLPAGTYDNFITFIQELTEAARVSENSLVVASIPESTIEIGGRGGRRAHETIAHSFSPAESGGEDKDRAGQTALESIEHTFGRMESIWKPVTASEGFEVVRRRLFLDCMDEEARNMVCSAFSRMYRDHAPDFPAEAKEVEYWKRMVSCYPIHPEIFDRLYGDWATLDTFQRTRGVLRLMAAVIHELWMANDASPMIMPGSIPLNTPNVRNELVRYLPETWNSIIDCEVDGKNSIPYQKDRAISRYGQKMAARRVARTVMLGSAPSTSALRDKSIRGLEMSKIRLGVIQPGESIADFNDALNTLHGSLSYLYNNPNGTRFWYDTRPTLRKTSEDRASQVSGEDVTLEIVKRLKRIRKEYPFSGLYVCPDSSNDIADEQWAGLVILRPEDTYSRKEGMESKRALDTSEEYLNTRGASPRIYRNMLAFIAPDQEKLHDLQTEVKRFMAWQSILSDKEDLNLDGGQIREAENGLNRSNDSVEHRLKETYCWLLVPYIDHYGDVKAVQWEISSLGGGDEGLLLKAAKKMLQGEQIITAWSPALLKMSLDDLLWKDADDISIKKLWEYLCTYCYLPRLANCGVLEDAIARGLRSTEFFGIAAGYAEGRYIGLKLNETVYPINHSDLLVKPSAAVRQLMAEPGPAGQSGGMPGRLAPGEQDGRPQSGGGPGAEASPKNTRFFMSVKLDYPRAVKNLNDYLTEVIQYLMAVDGADVELTLDASVSAPKGIPASTVRTVSENCRTLKIQNFGFEDD